MVEKVRKLIEEIKNNYNRDDVFDHPSCSVQNLAGCLKMVVPDKNLPKYGGYVLPDEDGLVRITGPGKETLTLRETEGWHGGHNSGHAYYGVHVIDSE